MSFSERITAVLNALGEAGTETVFSPWGDTDTLDASRTAPLDRRKRLLAHFRCEPKIVLVGEAPGYRGCHFSGIPFTSQATLLSGVVPRVELDYWRGGKMRPLPLRITRFLNPLSEHSATIVWRTLHELGIAEHVVMWNAFPWHPHEPGDPMSNRTPTAAERASGLQILAEVVSIYRDARFFPVGRLAEESLKHLGVEFTRSLRHPARGGAAAFAAGLAAEIKEAA